MLAQTVQIPSNFKYIVSWSNEKLDAQQRISYEFIINFKKKLNTKKKKKNISLSVHSVYNQTLQHTYTKYNIKYIV